MSVMYELFCPQAAVISRCLVHFHGIISVHIRLQTHHIRNVFNRSANFCVWIFFEKQLKQAGRAVTMGTGGTWAWLWAGQRRPGRVTLRNMGVSGYPALLICVTCAVVVASSQFVSPFNDARRSQPTGQLADNQFKKNMELLYFICTLNLTLTLTLTLSNIGSI